jgi:hypothetical protein
MPAPLIYPGVYIEEVRSGVRTITGVSTSRTAVLDLPTVNDIAVHVRQRARAYEAWGVANKGPRGPGGSALSAGSSGTGKTLAAEILADDLRRDLCRIDLRSVVSKYIGETEKDLRRVFDAVEESGVILLFDEVDSLFGKRSEVKASRDRSASVETGYLLQRVEAYRGLAILTTNLKSALDPAFLRRLRFVVQFPLPAAARRAEIWRRIFPNATRTEGSEPQRLAALHVPGGNLRNLALHAAFLAADGNQPVRLGRVLRTARGEYAKVEKPLTDAGPKGGSEIRNPQSAIRKKPESRKPNRADWRFFGLRPSGLGRSFAHPPVRARRPAASRGGRAAFSDRAGGGVGPLACRQLCRAMARRCACAPGRRRGSFRPRPLAPDLGTSGRAGAVLQFATEFKTG